MPGDRRMFTFLHDNTISFSDVDKTNKFWQDFLSKNECMTKDISGKYKEDDRCNTLILYFSLDRSIPKVHSFLLSNVGLKQYAEVDLNEEGWTRRLEWCLNKLYHPKYSFAMCFGDDWIGVGRQDLDKEYCWHPFSGTPDMVAVKRPETTSVVVAKTDVIECKETKHGDREEQLYAAMLLTAGTAILKRLVNQQDNSGIETVTVRGLLIHGKMTAASSS
ncbi:uncharacterized protein LOC134182640 [Corticium candelabrum]|uniref:uncharacterized protein LOC134182640 n=1 Tax=Corticium candelabrum TaxID=121492 RepID=UPI002E2640E5|nr:uncharacterized protein LOC134182640 [Corticium candelabrum]